MIRRKLLFGFATLVLLAMAPRVEAAYSTIDMVDIGSGSVNGLDLLSSTQFTIGNMFFPSVTATNLFIGTPSTDFGSQTIDINDISAFDFGNSIFGTFQASSAIVYDQSSNGMGVESLSIYIAGNFTPGTSNSGKLGDGPMASSFTIHFGENSGGGISDTGTLSVPPAAPPTVVPEPASAAMLGLGLVAVGAVAARRRSAK
jgi:PEP-CTERM motif